MTTRPELRVGPFLLPGVLAVALFGVFALVFLNAPFGSGAGFPEGVTITAELGYALLDLNELQEVESEPFLASFLLIAVVLDAALDASLVLAKREEGGESVTALRSVSGRDVAATDAAATDGGATTIDGGHTDGGDGR